MGLSYTLYDPANSTAKWLLDIGAVNFRPDEPFRYTSGRISPIYVDVRRICGEPRCRSEIVAMAAGIVYNQIGARSFGVIAGGETAGIPLAAWLSDRTGKPMCYIRKQPKGFGRNAQIEGLSNEQLEIGRKFLLAEDLCSDGGSKKVFTDAIRMSGNICTDVLVIYSYGIFGAAESLSRDGVKLTALTDAWKLLEVADDLGWSTKDVRSKVRSYLSAPDLWQARVATPGSHEDPGVDSHTVDEALSTPKT